MYWSTSRIEWTELNLDNIKNCQASTCFHPQDTSVRLSDYLLALLCLDTSCMPLVDANFSEIFLIIHTSKKNFKSCLFDGITVEHIIVWRLKCRTTRSCATLVYGSLHGDVPEGATIALIDPSRVDQCCRKSLHPNVVIDSWIDGSITLKGPPLPTCTPTLT